MAMSSPWRIVKADKSEYLQVWKVERVIHGSREVGFFKFTSPRNYKYIGPLLANELICYRLAQLVGLPVAATRLATIGGHRGIISLQKAGHRVKTWNQVIKRGANSLNRFVHSYRLYKTFVFDAWICNIDRSGKNIIVHPHGSKYDFYLIDHELALLGAVRYENKPWQSNFWDNIGAYTKGYRPALLRFANDYTKLEPYVQAVQRIRPATISAIVDGIPSDLLSKSDRLTTKKLLLHRQRRLDRIVSSIAN